MPHQIQAIQMLSTQNSLLADDCSLGKTLTAVELGKRYYQGPILVVTPRPVKPFWAYTIEQQDAGFVGVAGPAGRDIPYHTLNGLQPKYDKPLWVITHPEALRYSLKELKDVKWDAIIADEAHRFKNRKAQRTKALWKIPCRRRLALTATPWGKSPADLWAILRWLYPKQYKSYWRFFGMYVKSFQPPHQNFRIIQGAQNLDRLAEEIAPFYLRRTKAEVLDLPPLIEEDIPVTMPKGQASLYAQLKGELYAVLAGEEVILENALVRLLRLQQCALDPDLMVQTPINSFEELPAKVEWLKTWLDDHPLEPVVIVSRFRKFVDKWLRELSPTACIVGGMSDTHIREALMAFEQTGRMVGSLAAVCEGLNLQRASTMIIMDGTFSLTQAYQLANRVHRLGSVEPVHIMHLVSEGTVDVLIRKAMKQKWDKAQLLHSFIQEIQDGRPRKD